MTEIRDEFDPDVVHKAFAEYRWSINPNWAPEDSVRALQEGHHAITNLLDQNPAEMGELRVALILAGLRDEGWQQLCVSLDFEPDTYLLSKRREDERAASRLSRAVQGAIDAGLAWMLDELIPPAKARPVSSPQMPSGPIRFAFRDPLHPHDVKTEVRRRLDEIAFSEITCRAVGTALWMTVLQDIVDRHRHPTRPLLAELSLMLSDHQASHPDFPRYLYCRLSPDVEAPKDHGRPPRRRVDLAEIRRAERSVALEVDILWKDLKRQRIGAPQETAVFRVAERRGQDIPSIRKQFRRHRALVERWVELFDAQQLPREPSMADVLLLALYEDLTSAGGV